jgi:hypothetical protein
MQLEGKTILPSGKEPNGKYPRYEAVLLDIKDMIRLENDHIYNRLEKACKNITPNSYLTKLNIEGKWYSRKFLLRMFRLVHLLNERLTIYTSKDPRKAIVFVTENMYCMVMPIQTVYEDDKKAYTLEKALNFKAPDKTQWYE